MIVLLEYHTTIVKAIVGMEKCKMEIIWRTKEEQLWEVSQAVADELIKLFPNEEVLHNLNLRELALRLNLPKYE